MRPRTLAIPAQGRARPSRIAWRSLAGGLIVAFAMHALMVALLSFAPDALMERGIAAMACANVASLAGAATAGVLAASAAHRHVALTAYLAWSLATIMLMLHTAWSTSALALT